MIGLVRRNLRVFFRDRASVFFSLLGVLMILVLYILFLGDLVSSGMGGIPGARFLTDSWIMAGMLAVSSVTTTMGAFGIMVDDRAKKMLKDFSVSPLSRRALAGAYILSANVIGLVISGVAFVFAEGYILLYGGSLLSALSMLKVLGCILLAVLAGSAMMFFLTSFLKSQNAFAAASTVLGTLIGFLTGVYVPVGTLPEPVQLVIKCFPTSHAGALIRQIMMEPALREAYEDSSSRMAFQEEMGVVFKLGAQTMAWWQHLLVLAATAALFYGLTVWSVSRKRRS